MFTKPANKISIVSYLSNKKQRMCHFHKAWWRCVLTVQWNHFSK